MKKNFSGKIEPISISYGGKKGFFKIDKTKQFVFIKFKKPINLFHYYYVRGHFYKPKLNLNPGGFNQEYFTFQNSVYLELVCDSVAILKPINSLRSNLFSYIHHLTEPFSESFRGILFASILGNKLFLPSSDNRLFAESGLSHFFALSGLHVGLIVFVIWTIISQLTRSFWARFIFIIIFLIVYISVVGIKAPIFRASIMTVLYLYGRYRFRFMNSFHLLWVTALINVSIFPFDVFNLSFWLSYSALFSILYGLKRFRKIDSIYDVSMHFPYGKKVMYFVVGILSPYIGTMPIIYAVFGHVSISSTINNLVFIIPLTFLLYGLLLFIFFHFFSLVGSLVIGIFLERCIEGIKSGLELSRSIEGMTNTGDFLLFISIFVIGLILLNLRNQLIRDRLIFLSIIFFTFYGFKLYIEKNYWHIRIFDLGQAQAVLLSNQGKHILYDAGKETWKRLSKYNELDLILKRIGVDTLDIVLISHKDFDHYGNLSGLNYHHIENSPFEKDSVYENEINMGNMNLYRLYSNEKWKKKNNRSLVYKASFGGTSILLTGDIETKRENALSDSYQRFLKSDILLVPHHGSISSSSKRFIQWIQPSISLISVARRNSYNHPSKIVLERLKDSKIYRTDQDSYQHFISNGGKIVKVPRILEAVFF